MRRHSPYYCTSAKPSGRPIRNRRNYWPASGGLEILGYAADRVMRQLGLRSEGLIQREDLISEGWLKCLRYSDDAHLRCQPLHCAAAMYHAYKSLTRPATMEAHILRLVKEGLTRNNPPALPDESKEYQ